MFDFLVSLLELVALLSELFASRGERDDGAARLAATRRQRPRGSSGYRGAEPGAGRITDSQLTFEYS